MKNEVLHDQQVPKPLSTVRLSEELLQLVDGNNQQLRVFQQRDVVQAHLLGEQALKRGQERSLEHEKYVVLPRCGKVHEVCPKQPAHDEAYVPAHRITEVKELVFSNRTERPAALGQAQVGRREARESFQRLFQLWDGHGNRQKTGVNERTRSYRDPVARPSWYRVCSEDPHD